MKLAFLGLGKMGKRMVIKLVADGHDVYVWNRSVQPVEELVEEYESLSSKEKRKYGGLFVSSDIADIEKQLKGIRIFWCMLPAGDATESVLQQIADIAKGDDIIIDGGNAYYKDTQKRYEKFQKMGVRFLGIGVSGGIKAVENGFPLMVGGVESAYEYIKPILKTLAHPYGGYEYFGKGGVGHFIKMVHNGIEYGMMQAIGEGFGVLEKGPYSLDLEKVADIWTKGTIVSGFLLDRAKDALQKDAKLSKIVGQIDATGEADWTIKEGRKEGVPIKVIEDSLEFRIQSQKNTKISKTFAAKMVAALRHEFGGHSINYVHESKGKGSK